MTYFHLYYRSFLLIGWIQQACSKHTSQRQLRGHQAAFYFPKTGGLNLICSLNVLEKGRDVESSGRLSPYSALSSYLDNQKIHRKVALGNLPLWKLQFWLNYDEKNFNNFKKHIQLSVGQKREYLFSLQPHFLVDLRSWKN